MITIIHGEDITASREYFHQEKSKFKDSIILDGTSLKIEDLIQALSSDGLFSEEKHIFIEEFISKRKTSKESKEIIEYLNKNHSPTQVFLWESKDLTPSQIKQLNNATIKQFKLPQSIFLFLDSIKPRNGRVLIKLFHQTLEHKDEQFIFFMLTRHLRILLALTDKTSDTNIDEVKRLAPWQKAKLIKQSGLFSPAQIKELYRKIFDIDVAQKTGNLSSTISQSIDFLLLEI